MKKTVKISTLMVLMAFAVLLTGCARHYSTSQAKRQVLKFLKNKYDEKFEITDIEKQTYKEQFPYRTWYSYTATSKNTGISFDGVSEYFKTKSGNIIGDYYEEALYKDELNKELTSIETNADGWEVKSIKAEILSECYYSEKASSGIDEFKSDTEKINIFVDIVVNASDPHEALPSIFEYINKIYSVNKAVIVDIVNSNKDKRSFIKTMKMDELTYENILKSFDEDWKR